MGDCPSPSEKEQSSASKANTSDSSQSGYSSLVIDNTSQNSDTDNEKTDAHNSEADRMNIVRHWSTEQVGMWFQKSVPFERNRMEEYLQIFQKEDIDGQSLLTLKRNHRACFGMTDFEWLLLKEARKRLLDGSEKSGGILEHLGTSPTATDIENVLFSSSALSHSSRSNGSLWTGSFWKLLSIPKFNWASDVSKEDQIELLSKEVESLRGEIASADERETNLNAQLEHLDEVLRCAQLAGYLYTRTRWMALPGEPPIDDTEVDDWIQRFVVLQGSCIFFYLRSTDISPQDSILLEEIVEAGRLPSHKEQDGDENWFSFYITSCHGMRFECSTQYKFQVDTWLAAIGVGVKHRFSFQDSTKL
ncbi:hypothetical protein SUGI_0325350 [Cryptomeria japonica]|uniref:uncharacterized protein LOC131067014 isoform X2 n=1 Tax=Cryptomeria japonica TaxID=3369 RepID=UPI0024089E2B|nr:uncharacterized protein LOC131067014 isoform X2 [Cryptomeria japonica]GLJ18378.1 hypothetical protein SUGI_0325350 [Cryptomeria japonica]